MITLHLYTVYEPNFYNGSLSDGPILVILEYRHAIYPILTKIVHIFRKTPIIWVGNDGFGCYGPSGGSIFGVFGHIWIVWHSLTSRRITSRVIFLESASETTHNMYF